MRVVKTLTMDSTVVFRVAERRLQIQLVFTKYVPCCSYRDCTVELPSGLRSRW